jgi:hypothetical protein
VCEEDTTKMRAGVTANATPARKVKLKDVAQTDDDAAVASVCSPLIEEIA